MNHVVLTEIAINYVPVHYIFFDYCTENNVVCFLYNIPRQIDGLKL